MKRIGLFLLAIMAGCSTPPKPQPQAMDPYVTTDAGPDLYRISYRGPDAVSPERILDFALARASHLADQEGYRYFTVVDETRSGGGELYYYEMGAPLENHQEPRSILIHAFDRRPKRILCFRAGYSAAVVYEKYGLNRLPD